MRTKRRDNQTLATAQCNRMEPTGGPDRGRGGAGPWEAALVTQEMADRGGRAVFDLGAGDAKVLARGLVVLALVLGSGLLTAACSNDAETLKKKDACGDVDCSGHGRCALVGDSETVCLCDAGYHSEALSCVQDQPGEECSGVDCSGHGTCLVVQADPAYPVCFCDEGYRTEGKTNCVPYETGGGVTCGPGTVELDGRCIPEDQCPDGDCTPDICNSSEDCDSGKVCVYETGECRDATPDQCSPRPSDGGDRQLRETCLSTSTDAGKKCAQGLICVPHFFAMDEETGEMVPGQDADGRWDGLCVKACDPCEGTCDQGTCIALDQGGGFCIDQDRLADEGATCQDAALPTAWCEAGLTCVGNTFYTQYGQCRRACVPDNPEIWGSTTFTSTESADCPSGQVCTRYLDSVEFSIWYCEPGELQPRGGPCNDAVSRPLARCRWPDSCQNLLNGQTLNSIPGTCSERAAHCSEMNCPAGTNCRFDGSTIPNPACVAPGSVGLNGYCEEDIDCMAPATCQPSGIPGEEGHKYCLP